jgi:hypothetical protein
MILKNLTWQSVFTFIKKNWVYVILIIALFLACFKLFYSNKTLQTINNTVVSKEAENKLLTEQLVLQKKISDSLKVEIDSLYKKWQATNTTQIINLIHNNYDKDRVQILIANNDKQFTIFSEWLSKKSSY